MFFLRFYFWIAPHILIGILLFIFIRRDLRNRFPIFFSYLAFELFQFVVLFTMNLLPALRTHYFRVYIFGLVISTFLKLAVIYELSRTIFRPGSALSGTLRPLMHWVSGVLVIATTLASATLTQAGLDTVKGVFLTLELSTNVIFAALLFLLFLFTRLFHISWRNQAAGIALGFGVSAALEVGTTALRANFADAGNILIDVSQMGAYHVCTVIWLVYVMWVREPVRFNGTGLQQPDLEIWDQELQRMVRR
jgi:hypothetical protein